MLLAPWLGEGGVAPTAGTALIGCTCGVPKGFGVVGAAASSHGVVDGAEVDWGSFDAGLTCIEKRAPTTSRTKTAANHSARDTLPCIAEEVRVFAANENRPFPPFFSPTKANQCIFTEEKDERIHRKCGFHFFLSFS